MSTSHEADVVVLGGGFAGLIAALSARSSGARTMLLSKGDGATSLSTGAVDLLGYRSTRAGTELVTCPLNAIEQLVLDRPSHPYALAGKAAIAPGNGRSGEATEGIRSAITLFTETMARAGLPYTGDGRSNLLVPTPFGTVKPTGLIPTTMAGGDLWQFGESRLLVVGFRGLSALNPILVAGSLDAVLAPGFWSEGPYLHLESRGQWIDLQARRAELPQLAAHLDTEQGYAALEAALLAACRESPYTHVALPCAGRDRAMENIERLSSRLQARVFELPMLAPSPAFQRLAAALEAECRRTGIDIKPGWHVQSGQIERDHCVAVRARSVVTGAECAFEGAAFVLSTGHVVGGGLATDRCAVREPIFDLALAADPGVDLCRRLTWIREEPFPQDGHPILSAGVLTEDGLRAVTKNGRAMDNLTVAGALLPGARWSVEKSGLGIALATGYAAGQSAAASARS